MNWCDMTTGQKRSVMYEQGLEAAKEGIEIRACPYQRGSQQGFPAADYMYEGWVSGWRAFATVTEVQ